MTVTQSFYSSRGGGVVIALASRSAKAESGLCHRHVASGPLARRGSSPFPGATNIKLDKPPACMLLGFSEDFAILVIANVLKASFK